jgi:hypothetical protein
LQKIEKQTQKVSTALADEATKEESIACTESSNLTGEKSMGTKRMAAGKTSSPALQNSAGRA